MKQGALVLIPAFFFQAKTLGQLKPGFEPYECKKS